MISSTFTKRAFLASIASEIALVSAMANDHTSQSIQQEINRLHSAGGGTLTLGPGVISVTNPIILMPGVAISGAGSTTVFSALKPSMRVFDAHSGPPSGQGGLSNLKISAFGDKMPTRGTEADRAVVLGPFERGWCRNVEISGSRWVSLTCKGLDFDVESCYVHHGFRDGIQMYDVPKAKITNNIVELVADDAISCMTSKSKAGQNQETSSYTVISNNKISKCTGIKVLGRSNVTISRNIASLIYGYGMFLGVDVNFLEGLASMRNVHIFDNQVTNLLSLSEVSSNVGIAGLFFSGPANENQEKSYNISYDDIKISNNVFQQTSGLGGTRESLWWTGGRYYHNLKPTQVDEGADPLRGIYFKRGSYKDVELVGNTIDGFAEPILFQDTEMTRRDLTINQNRFVHCTRNPVLP